MNKSVISINQVLLFRDSTNSKELGEALWAAAKEVENFYKLGEQPAVFRRIYLSEVIPETINRSITGTNLPLLRKILGFFSGTADQDINKETPELTIGGRQSESRWKKVEGKFARTYDAEKILQMVRELAGEEQSTINPVVVTDVMLTPPPEWRYIIWDGDKTGTVISIPPTDPKFWRIRDPNRIAIIKHRVRTAFLSTVGESIGLKRCDNERCFLFGDVDSVTRLDSMVVLGPEHNIKALKQRGFEIMPTDPTKVQVVTENPEPEAVR
jgi:hypothetical protein